MGFEPTRLSTWRFSRPLRSTTPPSFPGCQTHLPADLDYSVGAPCYRSNCRSLLVFLLGLFWLVDDLPRKREPAPCFQGAGGVSAGRSSAAYPLSPPRSGRPSWSKARTTVFEIATGASSLVSCFAYLDVNIGRSAPVAFGAGLLLTTHSGLRLHHRTRHYLLSRVSRKIGRMTFVRGRHSPFRPL